MKYPSMRNFKEPRGILGVCNAQPDRTVRCAPECHRAIPWASPSIAPSERCPSVHLSYYDLYFAEHGEGGIKDQPQPHRHDEDGLKHSSCLYPFQFSGTSPRRHSRMRSSPVYWDSTSRREKMTALVTQ